MAGDRLNPEGEGPLLEPGRPLAVRRVLSGPGRDGYLRLNPGRPGASMRFSVTSAPHGRFGRRSTAAAVAPSGNGRETELAASLMAGDRRNLEEGPLSGAGTTSGGSPCPVRSGSGRISSTQPWSTRCLHEVLSIVSSPWEIRQTLHSCSGRTVGKRSGNGAGCQSDGRGPAESGRRTTLGAGATFGGSPCPVRSGSDIFDSTLVDPVPPRESQYRQQPVEDPPDAAQIHQAHCRETVGKLSWLPVWRMSPVPRTVCPSSGVSRGPTYRYRRWTRWCALTIGPRPEMRPSLTCHCSVGSAAGWRLNLT